MTIKEWLTPDFFALNVIIVALLMNFTIYAIVSNFTVDFKIGDRLQAGIYASATFSTLIFIIMVISGFAGVIERYPYLYENKYNFLLLGTGETWGGNGPVFVSLVVGIASGTALGLMMGGKKTLRVAMGFGAVASEALIGMFTLLWIVNQT